MPTLFCCNERSSVSTTRKDEGKGEATYQVTHDGGSLLIKAVDEGICQGWAETLQLSLTQPLVTIAVIPRIRGEIVSAALYMNGLSDGGEHTGPGIRIACRSRSLAQS